MSMSRIAYSRRCDISSNPEFWLVVNDSSQQYEAYLIQASNLSQGVVERNDTYTGRLCDCAPVGAMYCPEYATYCQVKSDSSDYAGATVYCIEQRQSYQRYLFAFSIFILCFITILCLRSERGHVLLRLLRRMLLKCCSGSHSSRYERSLRNDLRLVDRDLSFRQTSLMIQQRAQMLQGGIIGTDPFGNHHRPLAVVVSARPATRSPRTPQKALLKTKRQKAEQQEVVCPICLLEIKQGERIGDLACEHAYHLDCLKLWLQRKNVCPLCKAEDLALTNSNGNTPVASTIQNTAATSS